MKDRASSSSEFVQDDDKYEYNLVKRPGFGVEGKNKGKYNLAGRTSEMPDLIKEMVHPTSQLVQEEKYYCNLGKRIRFDKEENMGMIGRFDEEENLGMKKKNNSEYNLADRIREMPDLIEKIMCPTSKRVQEVKYTWGKKGRFDEGNMGKKEKNKGEYNLADRRSELPDLIKKTVYPTFQLIQEEKYNYTLGKRSIFNKVESLGKKEKNKGEYFVTDQISEMPDSMEKMLHPTSQLVQDKKYTYNFGKRYRFNEEENLGMKEKNKAKYNPVDRSEMPDLAKRRVCLTSQIFQHQYEYKLGDKHMPKNEKRNWEKIEKNNLVDRISEMPDEILVSILSLLPLKEVAATSVLSRRWQYVWMSTMTLNFDVNFHLNRNRCRFEDLVQQSQDLEKCRYVNWVNSVVEQHRGPMVEQFRACFDLDGRCTSSIDKWIQFAMEKGVQVLELDFFPISGIGTKDMYTFPHKLLGLGKEHSYPCSPNLHSYGYNIGFKFLKVIHFRHVDVTDDLLEYFLSNFPVLERLTVHGNKSLVNLRVIGSSIALKYLVIEHCLSLESIEICDTNLVSFSYRGLKVSMLLRNVPLLVEVSIIGQPASIVTRFTQLSFCLSQLESLSLDINDVDYIRKRACPIYENLKHLELIVHPQDLQTLDHLTYFLKAFPCLQRLAVKLSYYSGEKHEKKLKKADKCPHHYIKVLEIVGYRGRASAVEHVMYLIKSLVALEKVVIDPVLSWDYTSDMYSSGIDRGIEEVTEEEKARNHAMQHIKRKVPSTIEFVCL